MVRELAIFLYLLLFKIVFFYLNLLPLKEKITFVVSHGDNSNYVLQEVLKQNINVEVIVLCKKNNMCLFIDYLEVIVVPFENLNVFHWLKSIYHLSTSRHILVDNYYGFLAAVEFKKEVQCVQLWHASGALKKFGLEDEKIKFRSEKAKQRFTKVYSKFHKVVVGSDEMATIFTKSFNLKEEQILITGVPRTDFFFNDIAMQKAKCKLRKKLPILKNKKVVLYVPTYRDKELKNYEIQLDINKIVKELGDEYILLLRLHPAVNNTIRISKLFTKNVIDVSSNTYNINELLVVADYLVTDYSSVCFEFSLLQKPMIFFTYDLEEYKQSRGVSEAFEHSIPGPIVRDTDSIIKLLHTNNFDLHAISRYSKTWNRYSNGNSSYNLVQHMFPEMLSTKRIGSS